MKRRDRTNNNTTLASGRVWLRSQDSSENATGTERADAPTITWRMSSKLVVFLLIDEIALRPVAFKLRPNLLADNGESKREPRVLHF